MGLTGVAGRLVEVENRIAELRALQEERVSQVQELQQRLTETGLDIHALLAQKQLLDELMAEGGAA